MQPADGIQGGKLSQSLERGSMSRGESGGDGRHGEGELGEFLLSHQNGALSEVSQVRFPVPPVAFLACTGSTDVFFSLPDLITGRGNFESKA